MLDCTPHASHVTRESKPLPFATVKLDSASDEASDYCTASTLQASFRPAAGSQHHARHAPGRGKDTDKTNVQMIHILKV